MKSTKTGITYKKLKNKTVASIRLTIQSRKELFPILEKLLNACRGNACGTPVIVYHWDTGVKGFDVEICLPVQKEILRGEIKNRMLEGAEAMTIIHYGSYDKLNKVYKKVYSYTNKQRLPVALTHREVLVKYNPDDPKKNITEIQAILHNWNDRFSEQLDKIFDNKELKKEITIGINRMTPKLKLTERAKWLVNTLSKFDKLTDKKEKFEVLSKCAHVFPKERIDRLRTVYLRNKSVDEVLAEMHKDKAWYSKPIRKGNTIYNKKPPADPEGYKKAKTRYGKIKKYCHCPLISDLLGKISPTFCYCGTGWDRQLWEGILGKPVKVEIIKSLTKGDDYCEFAIHI